MSELRACPFCLSEEIDPTGWRDDQGCQGPECENCGATARSVFDWNRRAPLPVVTREELALALCQSRTRVRCACADMSAEDQEAFGRCGDGSWAHGLSATAAADAILALLREKGAVG